MNLVTSASDVNGMSAKVVDTGGLYFVTAFGGLFAPYWDPSATGMIIGKHYPRAPDPVIHPSYQACLPTQLHRMSHVRRWRLMRS